MSTWRESCRPFIAEIISEHKGKTEKEIRSALRKAYPWGERKYHPYKIWCSEVNLQIDALLNPHKLRKHINEKKQEINPDQLTLL